MVAITVILASVIGTFIFTNTNSLLEQPPQATFSYNYDATGNGKITVTHTGGNTLEPNTIIINDGTNQAGPNTNPYRTGDTFTIGDHTTDYNIGEIKNDHTIRIIWQSQNTQNSHTIGTFKTP